MLTPHQQEKYDQIMTLLHSGVKRITLQGSAGTGKTVLASELVKAFKKDYAINQSYNNGHIYVTAPTNKALAVLMGKIDTAVEFKTIHGALKMTMYTDSKTGHRKFVRAKGRFDAKEDFDKCKVCIIDECSMLNSEILGYLENYPFPIIYIGDEKQLAPVGEERSPIFDKGYPVVELTEIIRQGAGNPIIDLSRDIDLIYFKQPKIIEGKGYAYSDFREGLIEQLAEVNGTDDMKYLALTNYAVDNMNSLVRQKVYGANPKRVEKNETIVFNTPFGSYYTNKELKVERMEVVTDYLPIPAYNTKFDRDGAINNLQKIRLKYYLINDEVKVIHEHSDHIFKTLCNTLKDNCKTMGWDWKGYYFFAELFADIKYNHAISVHKSQGSTYQQTILNVKDIHIAPSVEARRRLLYTGITRAAKLLILNNVK